MKRYLMLFALMARGRPIDSWCPDNGARVNIEDCSITSNVGATELVTGVIQILTRKIKLLLKVLENLRADGLPGTL